MNDFELFSPYASVGEGWMSGAGTSAAGDGWNAGGQSAER